MEEFVILDEKKANTLLQTCGYSASVGEGIRSLSDSLTRTGEEVNRRRPRKGGLAYLGQSGKEAMGIG